MIFRLLCIFIPTDNTQMRLNYMRSSSILFFIFLSYFFVSAQKTEQKKYPALLWQITGNGLVKPSYLFGTMHVSSKMVFNLSDSFYFGIRNSDVVALELDPQLWQDQMFRFQKMQNNLRLFSQGAPNDYLNEKSFQIEKYEDKLKAALSEEPTIINGLLYRTYQQRADFEEDTYLDLYIYQTGRKLGKQATGVENYFETEKLILEATQDMMKDKKHRSTDTEGESIYDIEKKTQDAYRRGDLDLLDSLEHIMQPSNAYLEKFLYKRNEIQANSIDSILKKHSLFVGVGAAHLPGKRGVIELLRQKGYKLRPILIQDRDAAQRDEIDKIKVPVSFSAFTSDDGQFSVKLPGKLYKREDSRFNDSWQYADMSNGAYYMVTRVPTYSCFLGQTTETVLRKMDSLLYENTPGKILSKKLINCNGYRGYDVTNKTRRGDVQRYNIFVTPFEVIVFKISGTGNYAEGDEANNFFNSINIKKGNTGSRVDYEPSTGGFKVQLPEMPFVSKNVTGFDAIPRWEYEANDSANGDAYLILKKSVQNFHFLEEDSFNIRMMEESFRLSECVDKDKTITTKYSVQNGRPVIDAEYRLKEGDYIKARYIIKGAHYFMLATRSKKNKSFSLFFDSFSFEPFHYYSYRNYVDTFMNISVSTPVVPDIDGNIRTIYEKTTSEEFLNALSEYNNYWPHSKNALFKDDSTGEAVYVSMEPYPKYYYPKDTATFWKDEVNEKRIRQNLIIQNKSAFRLNDSVFGYKYVFSDTGSSRLINSWMFVKDNRFYRIMSLNDSIDKSDLVSRFYESLKPIGKNTSESVFTDKLDLFFHDFYSKDSVISKKARAAIPNVYFGPKALPRLLKAIDALYYNNNDYFDTKTKLINELGYIRDSSVLGDVVSGLKRIFEKSGDTSAFQNAVVKALAKNKTSRSYDVLKVLLLQDPPVFNNSSDYNYLFQDIGDSLKLARMLFPELLQLSSVDDYKDDVQSLLTNLVDSGYIKADDYTDYFNKIYFGAKIQLKKQMAHDEQGEQKKDDDVAFNRYNNNDNAGDENNGLDDYAVLLMPFYDKNNVVPKFFEKLLQSKDASLRLNTAVLMIRYRKPVADSILQNLAKDDKYRFNLYKSLEHIGHKNIFPAQYATQLDMARSSIIGSHPSKEDIAIEFVGKKFVQYKLKKGWAYFFKYKNSKDDESWQMGISGLQPENLNEVGSDNSLVLLINKKLKKDKPVIPQFEEQLKHLLFSKYKSGVFFYLDNSYYLNRNNNDDD
ncbi:MAG TPA: TraB/GumN family protein [Puia sp.]|nr:TraB/GumN family protein [Puia sp.]